jgi:hypothetical protein
MRAAAAAYRTRTFELEQAQRQAGELSAQLDATMQSRMADKAAVRVRDGGCSWRR